MMEEEEFGGGGGGVEVGRGAALMSSFLVPLMPRTVLCRNRGEDAAKSAARINGPNQKATSAAWTWERAIQW